MLKNNGRCKLFDPETAKAVPIVDKQRQVLSISRFPTILKGEQQWGVLSSNGAARDLDESLLQRGVGYTPVPVKIIDNSNEILDSNGSRTSTTRTLVVLIS